MTSFVILLYLKVSRKIKNSRERRKEGGRKKKERGKWEEGGGGKGERKKGGVEPTEGETVMDD